MGISRDSQHKRRLTGGKKPHHHKKRKHEMGRQMAMTKIGAKRIHPVRCRGGNMKFRGIRLDTGNFSWGSEVCTRKTRILDVVYNASNNELVRTKTLVKSAVVQIDATCGRPRPLPHAPHAPPRYHRAQWRRGEAWSAGWQRGSRRAERSAGARVDQGQMDVGRGRWGGDLLPPNPGNLRRCLRADPTKGGGRGGAQSWAGLWERSAGEMPVGIAGGGHWLEDCSQPMCEITASTAGPCAGRSGSGTRRTMARRSARSGRTRRGMRRRGTTPSRLG